MMLLFIIASVYHSDIIAPAVFQSNILSAGSGSYTSHIAPGAYKAVSCHNNKPDMLSSSHVWLAGTCFSWKESRFNRPDPGIHQDPLLLKRHRKRARRNQGSAVGLTERQNWVEERVQFQRLAEQSKRSAHLPDLPLAFCTPVTPQQRASSLIHVCCTSKCGLD